MERHKKKIMLVFGTRPEAIKMCPLVKELRTRRGLEVRVCVSGQHREMLDSVLSAFDIKPDYDLSVMKKGQSLCELSERILRGIDSVLDKESPDLVLVHGDTSSAFAASLACFYKKIPIGHVEAGLRTYDIDSPFPEEFNRRTISLVAKYHFAPTEGARQNLLREGVPDSSITVTGNTAIDALFSTVRKDFSHELLDWAGGRRIVLISAHRRENQGERMYSMLMGIRRVLEENRDICAIYPVHPSPKVRCVAESVFDTCPSVRLTEPLGVVEFHNIMAKSYVILTDSGGIQEEAPSLGIPVLVMRDSTERPEGVMAGALMQVGTDGQSIHKHLSALLSDSAMYERMSKAPNPYGDGYASRRIADKVENELFDDCN